MPAGEKAWVARTNLWSPPAGQALRAEFLCSAARVEEFPPEGLPEIAFLGRSNAGKSTLLNCLAGKNGLAFTSATPGRTRSINFYRVGKGFQFVDLPGYGFAAVSREAAARWRGLIEAYLLDRRTLALCILVLDARRGWTEKDLELRAWLEFHGKRYVVVATKTDKLKSQKERARGLAALQNQSGPPLLLFSAVTGQGVKEIWQEIWKTPNRT